MHANDVVSHEENGGTTLEMSCPCCIKRKVGYT